MGAPEDESVDLRREERRQVAFGGGAETWYRLQAAYDIAQALKRAGSIKVRRIAA